MKAKDRRHLFLFVGLFLYLLFLGFPNAAPSQVQSNPVHTEEGEKEDAQRSSAEKDDQIEEGRGETFYRWADEEGGLYFTNELSRVPERYRDQVETLQLPTLPVESTAAEKREEPEKEASPPPSQPIVIQVEREPEPAPPSPYKEIPFDQFIRIQIGMDEAEVLSRLGFPSLVTPSDYFDASHHRYTKYRSRIVRLIYLGNRDLKEKTTVIEIQDGKVVNIERIFPF